MTRRQIAHDAVIGALSRTVGWGRKRRRANPCPHSLVRYVTHEDVWGRPWRSKLRQVEEPCLSERAHHGDHEDRHGRTWR